MSDPASRLALELGGGLGRREGTTPAGLLPSLSAYAACRLRRVGWGANAHLESSASSNAQLVNTAVLSLLDRSRTWNPDAVDLGGFLRGVIRSQAWSARKSALRSKTSPYADFERFVPLATSPEDAAVEAEGHRVILAMVEAAVGDDPDLRALFEAIADGATKRAEIAASLDWSPERVSAARIKLQRRLAQRNPEHFAPVVARHRRHRHEQQL